MRNRLTIATNKLKNALADYKGDAKKVEYSLRSRGNKVGFAQDEASVTIELYKCPKDFLEHLLQEQDLTDSQRAVLMEATGANSQEILIDTELDNPMDVHNMVVTLGCDDRNVDIKIGDRWYPGTLRSQVQVDHFRGTKTANLSIHLNFCDFLKTYQWQVGEGYFTNSYGEKVAVTGRKLLSDMGLRPLQTDLEEYRKRVMRAEGISNKHGVVMGAIGTALVEVNSYFERGLKVVDVGSPSCPKKLVLDRTLEAENRHNRMGGDQNDKPDPTPFVRGFLLENKSWCYVDEQDMVPHKFDKDAINRLVLPPDMRNILDKLFHTDVATLFGDVLADKHGGMIILANGKAGTGKTLTAEVFAEITERPLYVMEMSELGIDINKMEDNLQRIFRRVTRWNAVLLMDECDIFLAQRADDIQHNVIVGIFLRLMDYYKGLLFMTSNRAEAIDDAFKSRVTLRLDYPNLTRETRREVWTIMFKQAGMNINDLDGVPDIDLNGRQIRNMVRLLRALYGNFVTAEQVRSAIQFACK